MVRERHTWLFRSVCFLFFVLLVPRFFIHLFSDNLIYFLKFIIFFFGSSFYQFINRSEFLRWCNFQHIYIITSKHHNFFFLYLDRLSELLHPILIICMMKVRARKLNLVGLKKILILTKVIICRHGKASHLFLSSTLDKRGKLNLHLGLIFVNLLLGSQSKVQSYRSRLVEPIWTRHHIITPRSIVKLRGNIKFRHPSPFDKAINRKGCLGMCLSLMHDSLIDRRLGFDAMTNPFLW